MINVTFHPIRVSGSVPRGATILEAARMLGLAMEGPCNGAGTCGKDLVQVRREGRLETVLACKTILTEDIEVIVPSHDNKGVRIVEDFYREGEHHYSINPAVRKSLDISCEGSAATSVFIDDRLISVEDGDTSSISFGVALDIGTTTIASSLVNLKTGEVAARSSVLNPLVYYGHDVMSRIRYSTSEKNGLVRMHRELISAINLLIDILSRDSGIEKEGIYTLLTAGNTTMQHIFLNKEIAGIGEYPYTAQILDRYTTTAQELGIDICKSGQVSVFPSISAYVGGDIVSGLVAVDIQKGNSPALFIDIGTNGEMALVTASGITATSCAAGPCFEGMTISSGMRAGSGAIEGVSLKDGVMLEVIGEGAPRGICGSGLLDLVSEMIRTGIVNSRGRLQGPENSELPDVYRERLLQKDGKRQFRLSDEVTVSQEDIRQVQLARAAIRSGVEFLLSEGGVRYEDIKTVIIAGGFGYHISRESLVTVGLIPVFPDAKLSFVGNSSLEGGKMGLLDKDILDRSSGLARGARVIELANVDGFEKRFVREMNFA